MTVHVQRMEGTLGTPAGCLWCMARQAFSCCLDSIRHDVASPNQDTICGMPMGSSCRNVWLDCCLAGFAACFVAGRHLACSLACLLPGCLPAWQYGCLLGCLPNCLAGCLAAGLPDRLPGCLMAAWLPGCLAAWLPGCLPSWLPAWLSG